MTMRGVGLHLSRRKAPRRISTNPPPASHFPPRRQREGQPRSSTFGGTQLLLDSYTRDDLGRVVALSETIAGATTNSAFTYDPTGRLIAVSRNGVADASYEYDAHDNRTRVTSINGVVTGAYDV